MAKVRGYRSRDSYLSKDPVKRAAQLANLGGKGKNRPIASKTPDKKIRTITSYSADPIDFIEDYFYVVEGRTLIKLLPWQKQILTELFIDRPRPNMAVLGQPKKTGKSTFAAAIALWFLMTKPMSEIYLLASDVEQSQLVCFDKLVKCIRMNPKLRNIVKVKQGKGRIEYKDASIQILAPNVSVAGINPSLVIAEELWSWTTLEHKRSWDELTNVPTRPENLNLITSYAGYTEDEDSVLWDLYKKGIDNIGTNVPMSDERFWFRWYGEELYSQVPWVKPKYLEQQKKRLRENSYLRLHCNQWVSGEEAFIDVDVLNLCTNPDHKRGQKYGGEVVIGVDVGYAHDATAVCVVGSVDSETLCLVDHGLFVPPKKDVLDLEKTVENLLIVYNQEFDIRAVYFDPYQAILLAQQLRKKGLPMQEYPQTVANTCQMTDTLQRLLKTAALMLYENDDIRQHLLNAKVKETPRGWRLVKGKQPKKIDLAIALAMAVKAAEDKFLLSVEAGMTFAEGTIADEPDDPDDRYTWHVWEG